MNNPKFFRTSTPISRRSLRKTLPCFDEISRIKRKSCGRKYERSSNSRAQVKKISKITKNKISSTLLGSFNEDFDDDEYENFENVNYFSKWNKQTKFDTHGNSPLPFRSKKVKDSRRIHPPSKVNCKKSQHNVDIFPNLAPNTKETSIEKSIKAVEDKDNKVLCYSNENSSTDLETNEILLVKEKKFVSKHSDLNYSSKNSNIILEPYNISVKEFVNFEEKSTPNTAAYCNSSERNNNCISGQINIQNHHTKNLNNKQQHATQHQSNNNNLEENNTSDLKVNSDSIKQIIVSEVNYETEQNCSNSTRVRRSPFSFLKRKKQQYLLKNKMKEMNGIHSGNRYSTDSINGLQNDRKSSEMNKHCNITKNGYRSKISETSRKKLREDDILSGMYGGNLNACTKRALSQSTLWTSQSLRMSLPSAHACSGDILFLKKALDDLCFKHKDILQIQNGDKCERESCIYKQSKLVIKDKNSTQMCKPDEKLRQRKRLSKNSINAKRSDTSKISSNKAFSSHSTSSFSKEDKLDLVKEFKAAWEECQMKESYSTVALKSETHIKDFLAHNESHTASKTTRETSRSSHVEENDRTMSTVEGFKKPNISRKMRSKVRKANKKVMERNEICNGMQSSELLDETFHYPWTSTPLDSPETERRSTPSMLQGFSPVVEERSVNKLCDITNEATVFYANRTYGKNSTNKVSREEKLWFATFGRNCEMSDFSNSSLKLKPVISDENNSISKSSTVDSFQSGRSEEKENHSLLTQGQNIFTGTRSSVDGKVKKRKNDSKIVEKVITSKQESKSKELAEHFEEVSKWELCIENKK